MTAGERARVLVNHWLDSPVGESIGADREQLIESIAAALADAERRGMERAAKILDEYAAVCSEETLAVRKRTLMVMADQLRADAADDKAQAGEEG